MRLPRPLEPRARSSWKKKEAPEALVVSPRPADLPSRAAQGAALWKKMQCAQCHGEQGKGDGPSASTLRDDWKNPIKATDVTYRWQFRNGHEPEDVYRTFVGGLNGTPMPSYGDTLTEEGERWALVAYVLSLSPPQRPVLHLAEFAKERAKRIGPDGRVTAGGGR